MSKTKKTTSDGSGSGKKKDEGKRRDSRPRGVRPFWSGTIAFGLVSVPVDLFPAKRGRGVALRMLTRDGTPVERRYFCPEHEVDVHPEHLLRGYEYAPDEYVIVRDDDLDALSPRKSREIDLQQFVDLSEVDPVAFERPYVLAPSGDTSKAYRLLAAVMEESGKAGIATFVMRNKEYLVAILAEGGILRAETLRFAGEIRSPDQAGLPAAVKPPAKRVKAFVKAIRDASADSLPLDQMRDSYAEELHQLVQRKRKARKDVAKADKTSGKSAKAVESQDDSEVQGDDLMQVIKQSMESLESDGRSKSKSARQPDRSEMTKDELYQRAQELGIAGRSQMSKAELIKALEDH